MLALDGVACRRGGRRLFAGLSLALGPGGAALVSGANGAGKSSLLRLIAGLIPPAAGTIRRHGAVALADERAALDARLALGDALGFWAALDRGDAGAGLAAMGLEGLAEVPVRLLSAGQARRAALARVAASGAAIWLLDEPGNGLDGASLDRLAAAMAAHRARGGIVVAASHQPLGLAGAREIAL